MTRSEFFVQQKYGTIKNMMKKGYDRDTAETFTRGGAFNRGVDEAYDEYVMKALAEGKNIPAKVLESEPELYETHISRLKNVSS